MERFKGERSSVHDAHSGRPGTLNCVGVKKDIHQHIRENHTIDTDETVSEINISYEKKRC